MAIPKPWRPPKKPEKMKGGKLARLRGKVFQKRVALFFGGINRWPLPIGDVLVGDWHIQTKTLGQNFPQTIKTMLEDATLEGKKLDPEKRSILVLHESGSGRWIGNDLFIAWGKDGRDLIEKWRKDTE